MSKVTTVISKLNLKNSRLVGITLFVIVFAGSGVYLLTGSHAATPYASTTADSGSLSGGATLTPNCSASSNGNCI
jgi:hypothetical protein